MAEHLLTVRTGDIYATIDIGHLLERGEAVVSHRPNGRSTLIAMPVEVFKVLVDAWDKSLEKMT